MNKPGARTRERILATSLLLFNNEGETNVTTVDIANDLDISPGNLYYHFKGKESIIEALYARFEEEIDDILHAPLEQTLSVRDSWFYLYVVFEEIYKYRFLYQDLTDLLHRVETIYRRFRRLINLKFRTASSVLRTLSDRRVIDADRDDLPRLAETITLTVTHWLTYSKLRSDEDNAAILIHRGVFQVVQTVAPYLAPGYRHIFVEARELFATLMQEIGAPGTSTGHP